MLIPAVLNATAQQPLPPSPLPGYMYDEPFFPGAEYDPSIPTPDSILGFAVGSKASTPAQIEEVITALAAHSPRVKLFRYGTTHEGRGLHYLVIASETNMAKLDAIQADYARLADPRSIKAKDGDRLAETLPALAWMSYAIHGDELSGGDAALAVAHHLAAGSGDDVRALLDELVIVIDPLMNPDGRERCLTVVVQNRTAQPGIDDQSLLHTDIWPGGRTNHYLFDMNRDWLWASQPETRGRIQAIAKWHPHYFMEGHEMWSQDTFLFTPARQPLNPNLPESAQQWSETFAEDHAAAFDARGWRYYTGEWLEEWYPGYSSSWVPLRGAIGNLYEQASIVTDAVRRKEGTLETYRESVHKQLVSTMANLATLAKNRQAVLRDFLTEKRTCVSAEAPHSQKTYAVLPTANRARWDRFLDLLEIQDFEFYLAEKPFNGSGVDRLGLEVVKRRFPVGTLLIPGRQPEARLLAALMEFDPRMSTEFLVEERRELLRFDRSRLYEITGWSATMLFDLECITLNGEMPSGAKARLFDPAIPAPVTRPLKPASTPVAFVIDGADDASVVAAGRLMEQGVKVRVADKAFAFDGHEYGRGSVLITRKDNTSFDGDLSAMVEETTRTIGIAADGIASGLGAGDLPDLGGHHFILLRAPRIAVIGKEPFSANSFGACWYTIDHVLGLRASYLDAHRISDIDLRRYNVIVLPDGSPEALKEEMDALRSWVETGGTLVAIGASAGAIARDPEGIGSIRQLPDILSKPEPYLQAVIREWEGRTASVDAEAIWSHTAPTGEHAPKIPWQGAGRSEGEDKPDEDELKRRDAWRKIFMPRGAIIAGRVDDRSWLTAGCGDYLPLIYRSKNVLMVPPGVEAPIRAGTFTPAPPSSDKLERKTNGSDADKDGKAPAPGWIIAPPGYELRVRMSGLLWPEAVQRIANSACLAREE
ncbi:peptidase, partial [bacterium]